MPALNPLITQTPGATATYSASIAETYSWLPVTNSVRPLYAKAVYDVGTNAVIQNGATFISGTSLSAASSFGVTSWSRINVITATTSTSLTATNWDGNAITGASLPAGATYYGNFTGIQLGSGSVVAYKG
jgi:hypothetical protein